MYALWPSTNHIPPIKSKNPIKKTSHLQTIVYVTVDLWDICEAVQVFWIHSLSLVINSMSGPLTFNPANFTEAQ